MELAYFVNKISCIVFLYLSHKLIGDTVFANNIFVHSNRSTKFAKVSPTKYTRYTVVLRNVMPYRGHSLFKGHLRQCARVFNSDSIVVRSPTVTVDVNDVIPVA